MEEKCRFVWSITRYVVQNIAPTLSLPSLSYSPKWAQLHSTFVRNSNILCTISLCYVLIDQPQEVLKSRAWRRQWSSSFQFRDISPSQRFTELSYVQLCRQRLWAEFKWGLRWVSAEMSSKWRNHSAKTEITTPINFHLTVPPQNYCCSEGEKAAKRRHAVKNGHLNMVAERW